MATYSFSTITAAQALAVTATDTLLFDIGSANTTTVLFIPAAGTTPARISLSVGGPTLTFNAAIASATTTFADGSRLFIGTSGNDAPAAFGAEADGLYGGAGNDTLSGGGGLNQIQGNQGDDSLIGGSSYDIIYGGQDNDTIVVGGSSGLGVNFAQGNRGDDTINGSPVDNDTLLGGQGNDVLGAMDAGPAQKSGLYTLYERASGLTGGGNDFINGNLGDDVIFGGIGDDTLMGEAGRDYIVDRGGHSLIDGGPDSDFIIAAGATTILAGDGDDVINLDLGVFFVDLGEGNDVALGATDGDDDHGVFLGGGGRDFIRGGSGSDSISGGPGNDLLIGWAGADTISGGDGADVFVIYGGQSFTDVGVLDIILDWASEDFIYFEDLATGDPAGLGSGVNYVESTAATYEAALAFANGKVAGGSVNYVAVQVGADVFVFADSLTNDGVADSAVRLVGRSLTDISFSNITI